MELCQVLILLLNYLKYLAKCLCFTFLLLCRPGAPPVELTVNLHESVDRSSWFGYMNLYAGAFIIILHGILHHSVRPIARMTLGMCFIVEVYFLIKFLNKCLQFEFIVNIPKLVIEQLLLTAMFLIFVSLIFFAFSSKLYQLKPDELLAVIMPSVYCGTYFLPWKYVYTQKFLSGICLTILFGVYW